jgi:hypothetical protein
MKEYNIEEILRESQENVKKLNEKLKDIETLHNEIKESVNLSLKNPILFKELADKLNGSAELYLEGNNTIFEGKILEIANKIVVFSSEINRLVEFNLEDSFKTLENQFLKNSKNVINKELIKFDEKAEVIQTKINDFGLEITRLSQIDIEKHFNNHQGKLSEVFISVNGINGIITNISQNLNKISQNLGVIEQSISNNKRVLLNSINNLQQNQDTVINKLSKNIQSNHQKTLTSLQESDNKLDSIISYNQSLKKDLKLNKIIGFVLIFLILVTLIMVLVKNF